MTITDPIADMFTRVRNALGAKHDVVIVPFSKEKLGIVKILKEEGFIKYYEVSNEEIKNIKIGLKYNLSGNPVITKIQRVSKPGKRVYLPKSEIPKVLNGFGVAIISTSKGILSGRTARLSNVGGELLGVMY
jgi:small subunit ribosomal protein S8